MAKIERLVVENYRGASSRLQLEFDQTKSVALLFGENGTGKTTIADALDAIGNNSKGSLGEKSSTKARQHLPTIGKKPGDVRIEVCIAGKVWKTTLANDTLSTAPQPNPKIRVLRRKHLQELIEAEPAKRYAALSHFIDVGRVEQSENALRDATSNVKAELDSAVKRRAEAEAQLQNVWESEGKPNGDAMAWANDVAAQDVTKLDEEAPVGPVKSGYAAFTLDMSRLNYQPLANTLESHGLQSNKVLTYGEAAIVEESRFEDYIVRELINFDDVSYDDHADFIYDLADQAVTHFKSYLADEVALHNVLGNYAKPIADIIHTQMAKNYVEESAGSDVVVSQGFVPLKPCAFTAKDDLKPLHWAPDDKRTIGQYLYGGFARCAYPYQKFHSDTERILATVLERQALRWFRPVSGQFNIYYQSSSTQPEYIPDFVAALDDIVLLIETKKAQEVTAAQESETDVKAKAVQATLWCKHASDYAKTVGGKPWRYLLVPHDAVAANITLASLATRFGLTNE